MKKIFLSGVAFMTLSVAVAQNQATLSQVGMEQTSQQSQVGSHLNSAVTQGTGTNTTLNAYNKASTIQIGTYQTAEITQSNLAVDNTALLFQHGNNNLATSIQQTNTSVNNKAYLNQYGDNNNETRITQSNGSYNNKATIDMGGDGPTGMYPAGWTPVNGGTAIIDQSNNSHDNIARIGQSGNGHDGRIYQTGSVGNSEAYIDQFPSGLANTAVIRQTNQVSGTARIIQNQYSFGGGNGNNVAEVIQGSGSADVSGGNYTLVTQENANNISRNQQLGTNNFASINQTGNGNILEGLGGDSIARQIGSGNQLYITQNSVGGAGNIAHVSQMGTGNRAVITQTSN